MRPLAVPLQRALYASLTLPRRAARRAQTAIVGMVMSLSEAIGKEFFLIERVDDPRNKDRVSAFACSRVSPSPPLTRTRARPRSTRTCSTSRASFSSARARRAWTR
jgi:hypothetical protein